MRTIALACLALLASPRQDAPSLAAKLGSADAVEAENAKDDLLKLGAPAADAVRKVLEGSSDAAAKKRSTEILERLETRKNVAGLAARWGDRWYAVQANALHIGWARLKTEEKDGAFVLRDELVIRPDKDHEINVKGMFTCAADEYLTLKEFSLDISSPDNTGKASGRAKDGRLVVESAEGLKAHPMPRRLVVDFALLRLVTATPKTEGYPVDVLETIKPALKEGASIRSEGEEAIQHEGRQVKTRRIGCSDGEGERTFWVDAEGRLVKASFRGVVDLVLSDELRAKDLDTGN